MNDGPRVERIRHELKRRTLTVARVERLPANMVRIVLAGPELRGFNSPGFDDHIKVFFPDLDAAPGPGAAPGVHTAPPAMRDFTPRRYDASAGELWIDFFLHEGGPAAAWAANAVPGLTLTIGGPKGSALIALDGIDTHVLVGDETALPAIARRLEELPSTARAQMLVEVGAGTERPSLVSRAALEIAWVVRRSPPVGPPGQDLVDALRGTALPPGRSFVWVATESRAARAIRNHLRDERGVGKHWIKAAGYWQAGAAGAHERIGDDE
jgi:NADPH-dependent ferric siderophore reductase